MSDLLPPNWASVRFGDINQFSSQTLDPSRSPTQQFELYSVPIFPTGKPEILNGEAIGSTKQRIEPGDVLVCKINPRINRVWSVAPRNNLEQIGSSEWIGFRAPGMDTRFFRYLFTGPEFRELICSDVTGVGGSLTRAQPKNVATFPIPLAPLPEQKRIADKLDTVLARVDACRDRLDRIPALLKRFRQSILAAASSGRLTEDWRATFAPTPIAERSAALVNFRAKMWKGRGKYKPAILASEADSQEFLDLPESWIRGTLDQVTWSVKDGPHFSPKYQETGIPFISGGSIKPGKIDLSIAKFISQELHSELSQRCKPDHLDVLYTKGGTTGIATVNTLTDDFNVWVHVAVLKLLPEECINPFFLQNTLNSPKCYEQSQRYTHGVGNQDLGLTRMVKIVVPIPPVEEQHEIVRRVEILFAFADRLEARLASARKQAEQLTPALLAKAFRGELVPQDPKDEPASELLKRLAAQRETAPKAKRGKKAV